MSRVIIGQPDAAPVKVGAGRGQPAAAAFKSDAPSTFNPRHPPIRMERTVAPSPPPICHKHTSRHQRPTIRDRKQRRSATDRASRKTVGLAGMLTAGHDNLPPSADAVRGAQPCGDNRPGSRPSPLGEPLRTGRQSDVGCSRCIGCGSAPRSGQAGHGSPATTDDH